ncbi:MAG: hypothetical protein ACW99A_12775 [Candidatus Kariarchaeaceae archaeon]|jgi:hypothetical protein
MTQTNNSKFENVGSAFMLGLKHYEHHLFTNEIDSSISGMIRTDSTFTMKISLGGEF